LGNVVTRVPMLFLRAARQRKKVLNFFDLVLRTGKEPSQPTPCTPYHLLGVLNSKSGTQPHPVLSLPFNTINREDHLTVYNITHWSGIQLYRWVMRFTLNLGNLS